MLANTDRSFGLVTILFHWTMAGLFLVQFWIGLTMESEAMPATKTALMKTHLSLGMLILILWVLRVVWRLASARPRLPTRMERSERAVAQVSHGLLLLLLGLTPLAGWAIASSVRGPLPLPIPVFDLFSVPLLPLVRSDYAAGLWTTLHAFLAYFMLILAVVHALAAIRHQFTLKDGLLKRMIVPGAELNEP